MEGFVFNKDAVLQPSSCKFNKRRTLLLVFFKEIAHLSRNTFLGTKAAIEKCSLEIAVPEASRYKKK